MRSRFSNRVMEWTLLIVIFVLTVARGAKIDPIVARFALPSANNGEEFQNLVVDTNLVAMDRLYLGATNALYQLADTGATLQLKERVRTGPELDSPLCNHNGDCIVTHESLITKRNAAVNKTWTNNFNQILLIHEARKVLLACGSVKQGLCSVHRLENITKMVQMEKPVPVAANSDNATTAAFLGPGPFGESSFGSSATSDDGQSTVLYVAATFTSDPYRDTFPAVCTRSLSDNRLFQLLDPGDVTGQSGLMIRNEYRSDFRVYYVGGFHSDSYAYWASVQRRSTVDSSSPYISKLLRVCTNDLRYESYGELPLECLGPDNSQYNIMKAFYVGRLGDDALATGDETSSKHRRKIGEEFLVGVFVKGSDPWKFGAKDYPSTPGQRYPATHSAVCAFSMKDIRAAFMFNLQRCNSGIGKWNLPHFGFDQKCYNVTGQQQSDHSADFCQPIRVGGEMPATSAALVTYKDQLLTSVAADVVGRRTALFVGTGDGKVKKIYLQTIKNGREYGQIQLATTAGGQAVNADMQFDRSKRYLYTMTPNELFKIRVETCATYETCDSCIGSGDPYCGWCTLENRCSTKDDCPLATVAHGFLTSSTSDLNYRSTKNSNCPRVDSMAPMNASLYAPVETEIKLQFNFLPPPSDDGGVYQCIFETKSVPAEFIAPKTLKCHLPPYSDRPTKIDGGVDDSIDRRDHTGVSLKIWSSASSAVFYETRFTFYDCNAHQLCTSCVSSRWPCDWCLTDNRCIHDADACGGEQPTRSSQQVRIPHSLSRRHRRTMPKHGVLPVHESRYHRSGLADNADIDESMDTVRSDAPQLLSLSMHDGDATLPQGNQCPHIDVHELPEILLPNGYPVSVVVPVLNLEKLLPSSVSGSGESGVQLECITKADDHEAKVRGRLSPDAKTVQCENFAYHYKNDASTTTANFQLRTQSGTVIDRMQVRIYKCESLGSDCSRCLNSDPRYRCTWCEGRCQYRDACPIGTVPTSETAMDACPAPAILSIRPLAGPIEGGTKIEILGTDLGVRKQDVEGRIFIGGKVPCDVDEYQLAERVVCKTRAIEQPFEGTVEIRLDSQKIGRSKESFEFVQPSVTEFHPNVGPKSGGTEVTVVGRRLLDASDVRVYFGNLECKVDRLKSTSQQLICITSKSSQDSLALDKVTVVMDKANRTLADQFEYTPDPLVYSVHPLSSFNSGGRKLTVRGKYFTSVQKPSMYFFDLRSDGIRLVSEKSACDILNATVMVCSAPALSPVRLRKRESDRSDSVDEEKDFDGLDIVNQEMQMPPFKGRGEREPDLSKYEHVGLGFEMDGVEGLRQLDRNRFFVSVVPDPVYERFPEGRKVHRGEPLIIKGSNLNLASAEADVKVTVGEEPCNVTLIASDQLVCQPPSKKPTAAQVKDAESSQPIVIVRVGTLAFTLGQLLYDPDSGSTTVGEAGLDMALVGGVVGGCAALFVVAMVAAAVWWRKKSWQAEKEYKRIQLQMDTLESNVRQECKQAFAELQTDMSDLTGDLVALGIPFHTRRSYAAKTLFKEEHQAALRMLDWQHSYGHGYGGALHHSLVQFEQLLRQKQFVIVMVNALENQSTFGSQDRVYMASLLTAALAKNMNYLTELTLDLLSALIGKATQSKFPQLMLRRTESVVEKMLANWIALCMYDHMLEAPGGALFLMFKALKHQAEKGPVDQMTADARYSLSEDRLLKEQIDSEPILLRVVPPATDNSAGETILCRVLSCDTITQVKSKILDALYRNTPFSSRPSVNEIDLEWKSAGFSKPGVQLLDDDRVGSPTNSTKESWRRLHTVQYYGLPNHAIIAVFPKQRSSNYAYAGGTSHTYMTISSSTYLISNSSSPNGSSSNGNGTATLNHGHAYGSVPSNVTNGGRKSPPQNSDQQQNSASNSGIRYWHLVKPDDAMGGCGSRNGSIPEIYLTRLLATKGTVQQFIDDFFASALKIGPTFPMAIKYLFDFLEDEAERRGVSDPSVVYAWKNNSLPLRFWVNIIKNPDFLLDVEKTPTVDACLSVIAQTFMDSCSAAEQRLGKDSPSNKLLFARDLPRYRQTFGKFYSDVQRLPEVHLDELKAQMVQMSKAYGHELNSGAAVRELLAYAVRYKEQIMEALEMDADLPEGLKLVERFEQTLLTMGRHSAV